MGRRRRETPVGIPFVMPTLYEPFNMSFVKSLITEYLGMTLFLYITIATVVYQCETPDSVKKVTNDGGSTCLLNFSRVNNIAIAFGMSIFVLVYNAASYSGGHLNPAVTIGLLFSNKITVMKFLSYVPMQMLGAITGAALVKAVHPVAYLSAGGGANQVGGGLTMAGAWGLETISTFILVFTVLNATDGVRYASVAHLPILAPFAIGMVVYLCHLFMIPLDGCSINPARTFGTAVTSGNWRDHWIFWVGPLSGGVLASLVYEIVFRPDYDRFIEGESEQIETLGNQSLPGKDEGDV